MDIRTSIYRYCNYQERSHKEVRNKLFELSCNPGDIEGYISELIETGVLNEERYARAIATGKFRMKHWGKQKIKQQLKLQQVSAYCIQKALRAIDDGEYMETLTKLAQRKYEELRTEKNKVSRRYKVYRYLLQKGYEADLITEIINEILSPGK